MDVGLRKQKQSKPTIEDHLKYFNREGFTREEERLISIFLFDLWKETGHSWRPGNCNNIPYLTDLANKIHRLSGISRYFTLLVSKRFIHSHFFWYSESIDTKKLILDPTGVPEDFFCLSSSVKVTPYFGLIENAPEAHRVVYHNMKDMDNWGTRDLPPNFHP